MNMNVVFRREILWTDIKVSTYAHRQEMNGSAIDLVAKCQAVMIINTYSMAYVCPSDSTHKHCRKSPYTS